jgi:sulfatase-like protein
MVGLRELEGIGTSFTNVDQTEGTTFTIGGMVGSQCGIPLVTSSGANSMSGMGRFLPEAVCVGDLLSARGYHMAFVGGASLRFAGKGEFLRAHGFADRQGREELQAFLTDAEYHSGWGLYDDSLLDIAYDKFVALSSQPQNFGLFLLTLDTHAPDGHLSRRVADARYADGDIAILNAVAGADRLLHTFVRRVMASPHARDTVIVICSDHLAMKNGASSKLNAGARKNLFLIIDPQKPASSRVDKPGTTLDVGPTVLHALGYHAKLGLGRDLLGGEPTLREQLPDVAGAIGEWRRDLSSFWGLSELRSLKILVDSRTLEAGDTTLRIPALILFDDALQSEVFFEFDNTKDLSEYVAELKQGQSFVWVAPCNRQKGFVPAMDGQLAGDCVIASKRGARPVIADPIAASAELSEEDLRRVLASPVEGAVYEEQGQGLLEAQLPDGVGAFLRTLPPGSTFFQTKSRAAQRLARFAKLPPLSERNLVVTHSLPPNGEFYFGAGDLEVVSARGDLELSRVRLGDDLIAILRRHEPDTVIISAKDDARSRLSAATLDYFSALGIDLRALKFRGSFAAVLQGGRRIMADVKNGELVVLDSPELRRLGIDRVESAGYDGGNVSRIIVGGRDLSNNTRGLNIVVLTRDGRRLSLTVDTAVSESLYLDVYKATPRL